jgi:DNA-directed RNA polymerase specialized sigma24 family protein
MVVVLANMREHDLDEVAALLRLPVGTVKSRLFAARTKLKELLS